MLYQFSKIWQQIQTRKQVIKPEFINYELRITNYELVLVMDIRGEIASEVKLQSRCNRNRKRSKRRAIYCPIHECYIHSVSQKYLLFADDPGQLQPRGVNRHNVLKFMATKTLEDEWLEEFWCDQCKHCKWYHIKQRDRQGTFQMVSTYEVSVVPPELWQQTMGGIYSKTNSAIGEFTRRHAKGVGYKSDVAD